MYNEEQKLRFLETIESASSRKAIMSMFNRFEKYEEKLFKDISKWSIDQIYNSIESMYIFDFGTIKQYLSTLTLYKRYVDSQHNNKNSIVLSPKLDASNIDITQNIQEVVIKDPSMLKIEIENVRDPSQGHYICAAACFAWLGIDSKTMPNIKDSSIDFQNRSIVDEDCNIAIENIPSEIMGVLRQYWETDEAIRWHHAPCRVYPIYNGKFLHVMSGINSKKESTPIKYTNIRNEFANFAKEAKVCDDIPSRLEYPNILRSGGLYRLYQLEQTGVDIFSGENDDLLLQTYSAPGKTFDIRSLYRQYKRAFNYA